MNDRDPVIVGVAESDLGVTDKSILELHAQGASRAIADAGMTMRNVDAVFAAAASRFPATQVAEYLGIRPTWTDSTMAGGASYEMYVARAAEAIRAGYCDVALITYGSNQRSARSRSLSAVGDDHTPEAQFERPYGPLYPISLYAMAAQRHMYEFGTTPEQLAEVAVAARSWARRNPAAYRFGSNELTVDEVLSSQMLSSPLHALDCCLVTDGGGGIVMTTAARARDLDATPIAVLGHGECTTNNGMSQIGDLTHTGAAISGTRAFKMAGLKPSDVDVAQIYDSFTITVLLTLEALGFCAPGDSGAFVENGRIAPGGAFPMNTSGGGLSYCHPGIFGLLLIVEAVRQLRGDCGERQVPGAEIALAHGTGGILSSHGTVLLGKQR